MALALFLLEVHSSQSLARQRIFRDRLNPLDAYNDTEFIARYRLTKYIFVQLEEKIKTFSHRSTIRSHPIAASTQLAVALQFFATGSFQTVMASSHGISQPSQSWNRVDFSEPDPTRTRRHETRTRPEPELKSGSEPEPDPNPNLFMSLTPLYYYIPVILF